MNYSGKIIHTASILLCFGLFMAVSQVKAQDAGNARIFFKPEKGPLWTRHQLDSFLELRTSEWKRIVPKILNVNDKGDSLIYQLELILDPTPVDIHGKKVAGQNLPAFQLQDINGKMIRWDDLKGKPVVVNFWFTSCIPCIAEIPALNQLREKYKNSDVVFLSVTFEDKSVVGKFLKRHPFSFTPIINAKNYCNNLVRIYPLTLFIDRDGKIFSARHMMPPLFNYNETKRTDMKDISEYEADINSILQQTNK